MNILVSTTFNWNPGDDFIRIGAMACFNHVYGGFHNYFYWNRNPDLKAMRKPTLSNTFTHINDLNGIDIDLVLIAGSPDWYGDSYRGLFEHILQKNIPVIALGLGSPFENLRGIEKVALDVYSRENTLVTCRDENVKKYLPNAHVLPCPAMFAAWESDDLLFWDKEGPTLYVGQFSKTTNQSVNQSTLDRFKNKLNKEENPFILTYYKDEYKEAVKKYENVSFISDPEQIIKFITNIHKVVTTRLHTAIVAYADCFGEVDLIYSEDNYRIKGAWELLPKDISLQERSLFVHNTYDEYVKLLTRYSNREDKK